MDVAACRAAFEQAELRRMVEGWGLSRAGAAAVCAARPPAAAEDAAARLLGAPAVVTATPVPPLPPPPHPSPSLRPGVAPWRGISISSWFAPPSQKSEMLRECVECAQPPLSRDGLLALGAERARLKVVLGAALAPADWTAVERGVRRGVGRHSRWRAVFGPEAAPPAPYH